MKRAIAYYRISKKKKFEKGLSIEGQIRAVDAYAFANGFTVEKQYTEIESGAKNQYAILKRALTQCKRRKATLLVAKLDRMSRNVNFISGLMESKVPFCAIDIPTGEKLLMHVAAAFAEYERDRIADRTRIALQIAKARGVQLGTYGRNVLSKRNHELSRRFALAMQPMIARLIGEGFTTVRAITNELNRMRVPTFRRKRCKWHLSTVHKVLTQINQKL